MKFGFVYPKSDPVRAVEAAVAADQAGWDAFFVWETVWGVDPWVTLGAAAARTNRIRLGTMLTPASIRTPWKLAAETATLDVLSGGRAILSAGLGAVNTGIDVFGLPTDRKTRAGRLDEVLDILTGLWPAKPFSYTGRYFRIEEQSFVPAVPPIQERDGAPHIPIWMVGAWPRMKSMRRVLRCDGLLPNSLDPAGAHQPVTPEAVTGMRRWLDENAPRGRSIDIIVEGHTPGKDPDGQRSAVKPFRDAGATWWVESAWQEDRLEALMDRVRLGPPSI